MSEPTGGRPALRTRAAEIAVAAAFFAIGAIVMYDSVRLGARWADDGPQPGYFPFYLGLLICISSAATALFALRMPAEKNAT